MKKNLQITMLILEICMEDILLVFGIKWALSQMAAYQIIGLLAYVLITLMFLFVWIGKMIKMELIFFIYRKKRRKILQRRTTMLTKADRNRRLNV